MNRVKTSIQNSLKNKFSFTTNDIRFSSVGGGCINETSRVDYAGNSFFCKVNSATKFPHLFEKESHGLQLIAKQNLIRVPGVIDCFEADGKQVLLLQWINNGEKTADFWKKFGTQLAMLHQVSAEAFGLDEDNYMGSVLQRNTPSKDWTSFFTTQRLQPLIEKCSSLQLLTPKHRQQFEQLYKKLDSVFDQDQQPALVHGDLWSGNFMCDENSEPVLIDTATYFGHPAVDLGMTTLFGGFHHLFYEAYNHHAALPKNHREQWEIANLYPLLIHLFLFGKSYLPQIEETLHRSC